MDQITKVTPKIIEQHGLTRDEYERVLSILGREPNITELGIFSVMWSEHCSYKSSKVHLRKLPVDGDCVIQGPGENAGVVDIGDGKAVVFKIESHNHPSFIEPYQGAATGLGGILRDIFTMGAKPIASLNSLRFGSIEAPRMKYLVSRVVAGIGGYGNSYGCPTVGGEVCFDECYNNNILVNVFNIGLVDRDKVFFGRACGVGNYLVYAGAKTGKDGIHGATMASGEFDRVHEEKKPAVQVADPFTGNILTEACLELMERGVVIGIQDMGAAGLTCSAFEMASRAGTGIEMNLDKVPLRSSNMTPYDIMLSESQERMLLVVGEGDVKVVEEVFAKWGLDVAIIGRVTDTGRMRVKWRGEKVVDLPIDDVAKASPVYERRVAKPPWQDEIARLDMSLVGLPGDLNEVLLKMVSSMNICSREWVYRQYDQFVLANTVVRPGSDAAVLRIKGSKKGIALSVDCNSRYCYLDPYMGAMLAVVEGLRNVACSGAKGLAVSDCLNFGNPEKPEIMWQFVRAVEGIRDACVFFGLPVVSGNVSFYNETNGVPIYPTPTVAIVGLLEDVMCHCTQSFKDEGDIIILLGRSTPGLGGSEYLKVIHGMVRGKPPQLDLEEEKSVILACIEGIRQGIIKSAHDCSVGGIAVCIAECCFRDGSVVGVTVQLEEEGRPDVVLFGEAPSRIVISVDERDVGRMFAIARDFHCPACVIGRVGGGLFAINDLICVSVDKLFNLWRSALQAAVG